ncbi:MscL, Large-conductance mechanosensitive channel [Pyrenophora tritici-repentis]|nr:MscL, Large-conductance mechanosensitive channel [Pyrenophora tritici-repentis]PZD23000.1 MscL, Large-conductance mechanosensitive channel [Pyrenophora tritici-repentis]PZD37739.1 MscL, Large-conductance mechanosensitive channel [Pyrenophora tritici-repentis]
MPRLDETTQQTLRDAEQGIRRTTASAWESFSNFALRDNVLEVAVGLILASSFTACANALVSDIILPIISLLPFLSRTLDTKFVLLRHGPNSNSTISAGYNTPAQAVDDGAVVLAYGHFLDKIVRFAIVALALWVIANVYGRFSGDSIVKRQVKFNMATFYGLYGQRHSNGTPHSKAYTMFKFPMLEKIDLSGNDVLDVTASTAEEEGMTDPTLPSPSSAHPTTSCPASSQNKHPIPSSSQIP